MILLAFLLLDLSAPARELARKIVVRTAEIGLSMRNFSTLSAAEAEEVRRVIETDLRGRGVRVTSPHPGMPELRLSLAENIRGYVWTAEAPLGTAIVAFDRKAPEAKPLEVMIQQTVLLEQDEPVLDVLIEGDTMLVLEPARIVLRREGKQTHAIAVAPEIRPARDPRGRLTLDGGAVRAQFFGDSCRAPLTGVTCALMPGPSRFEKWLSARARNYLTDGARSFYSYAVVEDRGRPVTLFAGIDGRIYLEKDVIDVEWGSDIAGVDSPCGGRVVLATEPGENDAVRAYRIEGQRPVAVSRRLELPGAVTALWSNGGNSLAVVRDATTRKYAAYSLALACGR